MKPPDYEIPPSRPLKLRVIAAFLLVSISACSPPPAPATAPPREEEPLPTASPVPSKNSELSLALNLAIAQFFLSNPEEDKVSWGSLQAAVMELSSIDALPASFLSEVEGKAFSRPAAIPSQGPGFEVSLAPESPSTHRGSTVKFTATVTGLEAPADFHFSALPATADAGVDEVPAMGGDPSSSPVFETSFAELGSPRVVVRAYAPDGRTARAFTQVQITNRPPEVRVEGMPPSVHRGQIITPHLQATDPDGDPVSVSVLSAEGVILADGETPEFALGSLGETTLTVQSSDSLGASVESQVSIIVTNRPPFIETASQSLKAHLGQEVEIEAKYTDPDGDSTTLKAFHRTQELEQPSPGFFLLTLDEPGLHEVKIEALDEHGASTSSVTSVEVENRAPKIALLAEPPRGIRNTPIKLVDGVADPDGDKVTVKTVVMGEEKTWEPGEEVSASFSTLGPQEVEIIAEDSRGARVSEKVAVSVTNAPPSVELTFSPELVFRGTEVKITALATDPEGEGLLYKFKGISASSSASTSPEAIMTPTELGQTSVSVMVSDPQGAIATAKKSFEVLPRPPEISLVPSSPTASRLDVFTVAVNARCPETGAPPQRVKVLTPSGWKRTDSGFTGSFKSLGEQKIRVEAVSTAGSKSEAEATVTVTNLPPSIEVLIPTTPHHRSRPARFDVKYNDADGSPDPSTVEWQVDGGKVVSKDGSTAVVEYSRLGEISAKVTVSDSDGGSSESQVRLIVDNAPPTIRTSVPPGPHHRNLPIDVKITTSDIDSLGAPPTPEVTLDGQPIPPTDGVYRIVPSRLGTHEIKATATDSDGSTVSETSSFEVENSPPTVKLSVPLGPLPAGTEVILSASASDLEGGEIGYEFEANGVRFPSSPSSEAKLIFTKPGKHPVFVTAIDLDGARTTAKGEVKVE